MIGPRPCGVAPTGNRAVRINANGELSLRPLVDFRDPRWVSPYSRVPATVVCVSAQTVVDSPNQPVPAFLLLGATT